MAKRLYIQLYCAITGESLTLPLNPESTDLPINREINTYSILNFGEVAVIGNKQLQRITLQNILPDNETVFALLATLVRKLDFRQYSPVEATEMIENWINNGYKIRVIIAGYLNKEFYLESNNASIRESVADIGYSINLIECREPVQLNQTTMPESKLVKLKKRVIDKYIPSQLTGQTAQTIYKIAKLTYGGRFNELAKLNNIIDLNKDLAGKIVELLPL